MRPPALEEFSCVKFWRRRFLRSAERTIARSLMTRQSTVDPSFILANICCSCGGILTPLASAPTPHPNPYLPPPPVPPRPRAVLFSVFTPHSFGDASIILRSVFLSFFFYFLSVSYFNFFLFSHRTSSPVF